MPENTEAEIVVQLFSPVGQLVRSMRISGGTNTLDVTGLLNGIYTLQILTGQGISLEKILVEN